MAGQQADGGTGKDGSVEDAAYFDYVGIIYAAVRLATLMRRYYPTPDKPDAFATPWSSAEAQLAIGQALMWLGVQLDPHESVRRAWPDHIWEAHPVDGDPFRGPVMELWELYDKHLCPALQDPPYASLPTIDPRLVDKLETAASDLAKVVDKLKPARPAWATELEADAAQADPAADTSPAERGVVTKPEDQDHDDAPPIPIPPDLHKWIKDLPPDDTPRLRPAYRRDHVWLRWNENEGLGPAGIRDRWNGLDVAVRKTISKDCFNTLGTDKNAGSNRVKQALVRARRDGKANKPKPSRRTTSKRKKRKT